jgi:twitching motility protein PilT
LALATGSDNISDIKNQTEIDTSRTYENYSFRVNMYSKSGNESMAIRKLNENTIDIYDIMTKSLADSVVKSLLQASGGLILVTGPTGSGKSTTIAAMINWINNNLSQHIITLEDPIEYIFRNNKSLVSQRQIGKDTVDFGT